MNYLFPGSFGLSEETTSPAQATPIDETPTLSSAGAMYSSLLQLCSHVETEKLERTTLKQLVQRLERDFALLQPQIETLDRPPTSKSSLVTIEIKIKILEKRLSTQMCRYNSRLNSLQHQLATKGDKICQFEHNNSAFTLWKVTSIQLVFESAQLWHLKSGRKNPSSQPCFSLSPIWLQLLFKFLSIWFCRCHWNMGFYISFYLCW